MRWKDFFTSVKMTACQQNNCAYKWQKEEVTFIENNSENVH